MKKKIFLIVFFLLQSRTFLFSAINANVVQFNILCDRPLKKRGLAFSV